MLPSEPPCSRTAVRRPRILLVDDDPSVIRSLWRLLRQQRPHFQVNAASSANQAIEALSELSYDVVVTDLQMPGGGGQAVLNVLLERYPETARIVHSSQLEATDALQLRALADVILAKPARDTELLEAIERGLAQVAATRKRPAQCLSR